MSDNALLELHDVSFAYGEGESLVPVLENVDFSVQSGQRIALLGRSGSGKSTLLDIMVGILNPISGKIIIDNKNRMVD